MTTITVVRKGDEVAIASDSMTTFGDTRLGRSYKGDHDKILYLAGSWIGICGSSAHHLVLASAMAQLQEPRLGSRMEVYETFRRLHPILKEHAYLNPKEDEDDPYESSQITALIANETGLYGVFSLREVFEFDRFWGIGSGRNFALGAMYSAYEGDGTASQIAALGVMAGIEFDTASGGPVIIHSVKLARAEA
ncbi:MFS transporter [Denitratisoma oestradiolicum]|uniref:MFS transporter n=1 Tax=Denitratisoma oestradiolicum TaxID=311182 RepID=A0A6S6Y0J5_9PROT|nr:MFS transporter [Denitratisoma oestradiolicum]TWO81488.1 MFS transporter [Denitratisoma oestradiolicum]CAB1368699.1 MFS transporter [Denitratisoma oestradiolicum]